MNKLITKTRTLLEEIQYNLGLNPNIENDLLIIKKTAKVTIEKQIFMINELIKITPELIINIDPDDSQFNHGYSSALLGRQSTYNDLLDELESQKELINIL